MNTDKKIIISKVNELFKQDKIEEPERLLENYINQYPKDLDMLLRFAVFELNYPIYDHIKSIEAIDKILELDSNNIDTLLLLSYIKHFMLGDIDQKMLKKFAQVKTDDLQKLSMLEYVKSWFYDREKNYDMYEKTLLKSISLYSKHVYNNLDLGRFYLKQGNLIEAKKLLLSALNNIELVFPDVDYEYDCTDVNKIFYEFIKGTHTTSFMKGSIIKSLEELESKLTIEA